MLFCEFISRAIEIPFKKKGRDWDGVDCWGLIVLAFREVRGVDLPNHENDYASTFHIKQLQKMIDRFSCQWVETNIPQPMDSILLRARGMPIHIGLIIDGNGNFLHIGHKRNAFIDNIKNLAWQGPGYNNVEGVYRYVGQC